MRVRRVWQPALGWAATVMGTLMGVDGTYGSRRMMHEEA